MVGSCCAFSISQETEPWVNPIQVEEQLNYDFEDLLLRLRKMDGQEMT